MDIAAAYIRVSTDDQLEYSPDSQLRLIRAYADSHEFLLPDAFIFREADGVSGRRAQNRPAFQRMIAAARCPKNEIRAILVWKFSRFARNQEESVVYKSLLRRECGIRVISVSEPIAAESEFGSLIERIIEWMDGYYSTRLAGEVRRGMAERVEHGRPVAAAPFGYQMKNGRLFPDPDRAPVVRQIFADFAGGCGCRAIAQKLNAMGIRTARGGVWESRTVNYILHNPTYIGQIRWHSNGAAGRQFDLPDLQIVQGEHEPIIDPALWRAAQARSASLRELYRAGEKQSHTPHAFQGLLRCSTCGRPLSSVGEGYQCSGYLHGQCPVSHYISSQKLCALIAPALTKDLAGGTITLRAPAASRPACAAELIERQIAAAQRRLLRSRDAYERGIDTPDEYRAAKERISAQIGVLESQLDAVRKEPHDTKELKNGNSSLDAAANLLLRSLVDHIVLDRDQRTIQIVYRSPALQ